MKLVLVTNLWNHYQGSLASAMASAVGENEFRMVLCEQLHEERKALGWPTVLPSFPWLVGPPLAPEGLREYAALVNDADVVIFGSSPHWMQLDRALTGKLTFISAERMWKKPLYWWRFLNPRFVRGLQRMKRVTNRPNVHYLAIGEYAAADMQAISAYGERIWNWGYFAEVPSLAPSSRPQRPLQVMWAGRMLNWKRADLIISAAAAIKDDPRFGAVEIIGTGPELARLQGMARELELGKQCIFSAPLPPEGVLERMRSADLYVLASDRGEGWGVVANEAMAQGSVLAANSAAGASRQLVEHGKTGFLFEDAAGLVDVLKQAMAKRELLESIRVAAWNRLRELWSPHVAAERFVALADGLMKGRFESPYTSGPCASVRTQRPHRSA